MSLSVTCYSGHKGDERPIRFRVGDVDHMVEEVIDQWYGPDDAYFRVRTDDGGIYLLRQHRGAAESEWSLESQHEGAQ
ncbi:MAG: hypothetical protein HY821_05365 [Acidobacteria bacterium]|nr:hypothetical protein [Acidobacteriota bacterium]